MSTESALHNFMDRLATGDPRAAQELFDRYAGRLIRLAETNLNAKLRRKEDPEDVVQSALKSFFTRHAGGQYDLTSGGSLWPLLAAITAHKCADRARRFGADKRDVAMEESGPSPSDDSAGEWRYIDRNPGPEDAAILLETAERLMQTLNERDQKIVELSLLGHTPAEIEEMTGFSLATVYRVLRRIREWLEKELGGDAAAG